MSKFILCLILLVSNTVYGIDFVYRGEWQTNNRPLNGVQTAIVTPQGNGKYKARFYGTWQGVDYDYTVNFQQASPANRKQVKGTALIDGASYEWQGTIDVERFDAVFGGSRYNGSFSMKRVQK